MARQGTGIGLAVLLGLLLLGPASGIAEGDVEAEATPMPGAFPTTMYVSVEAGSCLNVREKPSTAGAVVFRLERGEEVSAEQIRSGWAYVSRAGDYGWASLEFLSLGTQDVEAVVSIQSPGRVRMRARPDGPLIGWLEDGQTVTLLGEVDGETCRWARIRVRSRQGYVMRQYVDGTLPAAEADADGDVFAGPSAEAAILAEENSRTP